MTYEHNEECGDTYFSFSLYDSLFTELGFISSSVAEAEYYLGDTQSALDAAQAAYDTEFSFDPNSTATASWYAQVVSLTSLRDAQSAVLSGLYGDLATVGADIAAEGGDAVYEANGAAAYIANELWEPAYECPGYGTAYNLEGLTSYILSCFLYNTSIGTLYCWDWKID